MSIHESLFESDAIRFAPIDYDKDPQIESQWTHNPLYMRMVSIGLVRPKSPEQVKKKYEQIEKETDEKHNLFYFTIRAQSGEDVAEDRLIGFAKLFWIEWANGTGNVQLGIGDPNDWRRGYGSQALQMLLRYAFDELNLFRLMAVIPDYNLAALRLFGRAGFVEEARRREALNRDGRRWDVVHMGILRQEWEGRRENQRLSDEAVPELGIDS